MKIIAIKDFTAYWNSEDKRVINYDREENTVKEGTIFNLDFIKDEDRQLMLDQLKELNLAIPFADYRDIRMEQVFEDDTKTQE